MEVSSLLNLWANEMHDLSAPRHWWHRYPLRLSVRGLMIAVLIIGGSVGWVVHRAHVQRDAVYAIERAGGIALYDFPWGKGDYFGNYLPVHNARLVSLIGVDYFGTVRQVMIDLEMEKHHAARRQLDPEIYRAHIRLAGDDLMALVWELRGLEKVGIMGAPVTDAGLIPLTKLRRLKMLDLGCTKVTGTGLVHVAKMARLEQLGLHDLPITDDDLERLVGLSSLMDLDLDRTRVSDAGVARLIRLKSLKKVLVQGTRITGNGITSLQKMRPTVQIIR